MRYVRPPWWIIVALPLLCGCWVGKFSVVHELPVAAPGTMTVTARLTLLPDVHAAAIVLYVDGKRIDQRGISMFGIDPPNYAMQGAPETILKDTDEQNSGLVSWTMDLDPGPHSIGAYICYAAAEKGASRGTWLGVIPGMSHVYFAPLSGQILVADFVSPGDVFLGDIEIGGTIVSWEATFAQYLLARDGDVISKTTAKTQVVVHGLGEGLGVSSSQSSPDGGDSQDISEHWLERRYFGWTNLGTSKNLEALVRREPGEAIP